MGQQSVSSLMRDLRSMSPEIKYCAAKNVIAISETHPAQLYPQFPFFAKLLDGENQVMKWTAIRVLGNLSQVDRTGRVTRLLPRLFGFLKSGNLITANNTIMSLTQVAKGKPALRGEILTQFLKVERYRYESEECGNIVIGKAITALGEFDDHIQDNRRIRNFLERQTHNTRNATKMKALKLLRRLERQASRCE